MSLRGLGLPAFLIGLAGLLALLFVLQRLRVRYKERTVVTTLFWREALEEARARVFVRRFRHPLAWLLVAAIAALMWLGFAEPRADSGDGREHVVLIDGSAGMARGGRFAKTVELAREHVRTLPRDHRRVVWCGAGARTMLAPGEHADVLDERLRGLAPEACPPSVAPVLRAVAAPATVVVAGDARVSRKTLDRVSGDVRVYRLAPPMTAADNAGITALGVRRAESGAWDRVDVACEVTGRGAPELGAALDGEPVRVRPVEHKAAGGRTRLVFRDLPARGGLLSIRLAGRDALGVDDSASVRLPQSRRIRVAVSPGLRPLLGDALAADPAVVVAAAGAEVAIRRSSDPEAKLPQLVFVAPDSGRDELRIAGDSAATLRESLARLGLGRTAVAAAEERRVEVRDTLLGADRGFVDGGVFPVFVALAVRWLAGAGEHPAFVAAGEAVAGVATRQRGPTGRSHDPVGAAFVPPFAGPFTGPRGTELVASLQSPAVSAPPASADTLEPLGSAGSAAVDLGYWLAVLALALLLVEWFFVRTGRMP